MAIHRTIHDKSKPYVVITNTMFFDESICPKCKGVLGFLLCLPDDWVVHAKWVANKMGVGEDYIYSTLKKLRKAGYCKFTQTKNENGTFSPGEYEVSEFPRWDEDGELKKFPPHRGFPHADNPGLLSTNSTNSATLSPSTQEPPTPEPQVSQAREEALKQLTLDSRALALARSPTYSDDLIINAVARVIEYNQPCNASALLTKAIQEKWKPRETSTIKPQKKELEADIISRLEALGAKRKDIAAAAFLLKRNTEDLRSQLDELKEMVDNGDPLPAPILAVLKYLAENSKK